MRNKINDKGRLQITIDSLVECCPFVKKLDFRIIDNYSSDGSWDYLSSLSFGVKSKRKRVKKEVPWLATTLNNMANLKETIFNTDSKYIWNIENDSYFFNQDNFLKDAIDILDQDKKISVVHLRRWVDMDAKDLPGVPRNLSRVSEVKTTSSGLEYYVMEKRKEYSLWVPLDIKELGSEFTPDLEAEYGKCPIGVEAIGAIRKKGKGKFERLLTEHWNSYTSHGWIGRKKDLKFLINKYDPLGERQMSVAFKKHFQSARLKRGAFISFGWKARANPLQEEISEIFNTLKNEEDYSFFENFECYKPDYSASKISIPEDKLNVYE